MPDNFHLAPDPVTVDGLLAVPIDIQQLDATLTFDAATATCAVDATIDFVMGPAAGNPVFDVRQTIGSAWLDGTPIAAALLAHHDFGGGGDSRLRIVESVLAAGSAHTLRLTYQLALPDALNSSSGPPTYDWNGDQLNLKFWYTDLQPGRYLDAWLPGNLIFDQFPAHLDIRIDNSAVAHVLVTNGTRTDVAQNHWEVDYPDWYSVCSSMLRIHPDDEVESRVGSVVLAGAGNVDVHTHKETGAATDLAVQEAAIIALLQANSASMGPYVHGDRFTAFFDSGAMEYAGATQTSIGFLTHETYHSWWARGVQPATQNDAWWDEAWTTYATSGWGPAAFNFLDPPVKLHSQNAWVRATAGASYTSGREVFQGLASILGGTAPLEAVMADFYQERAPGLATTIELEGALLCTTADETVVDGFHRFVYGFSDPAPAPDLWMKDDPGHLGDELWGGTFWNSPDIWVRVDDDGGTTSESPQEGRDNWFHARVRNLGSGTARHFMVTFQVKQWAGTQFVYPGDFLPCIAATGGFELAPGEEQIVKARWPAALVPAAGTHGCLLASVMARADHPTATAHVWEDNNLAQRNLTIAELDADGWVVLPVLVGTRRTRERTITLELLRPRGGSRLRATLLRPVPRTVRRGASKLLDCGGEMRPAKAPRLGVWTNRTRYLTQTASRFKGASEQKFRSGKSARMRLTSESGFPALVGLRLRAPRNAKKGRHYLTHLVERDAKGRVVGGVSVQIDIR